MILIFSQAEFEYTTDVIYEWIIHLGGNVNLAVTSGTPGNTASPASWLKVYVGGTTYFMPLYQ